MKLTHVNEQGERVSWQEGESFFLSTAGELYFGDEERNWEVARVSADGLVGTARYIDRVQNWVKGIPERLVSPQIEGDVDQPFVEVSLKQGPEGQARALSILVTKPNVISPFLQVSAVRAGEESKLLAHTITYKDEVYWTAAFDPSSTLSKLLFLRPVGVVDDWAVGTPGRRSRPSALASLTRASATV